MRAIFALTLALALQGQVFAQEEAGDAGTSAPVEKGTLTGNVTDANTGETLIEATIKVLNSTPEMKVLTDVDGNYTLELPEGTYELRVFYDVYQARKFGGVVVHPGKTTRLDVKLSTDKQAVQEVVVEARADRRNEQALLEERKRAATVSDAVSAQEMARTPDSSASDAVKRVVSVTVVDDRNVLLRGLGGKYVSTLLNGTLVPSPEPDDPSVPLDIFPASLLANLNVIKTYSPHLPGQFGGGTLAIESTSLPTALEVKAGISLGANTQTTFRLRPGQQTNFAEALSFPSAARILPREVPNQRLDTLSAAELEKIGESFRNRWVPIQQMGIPNLGASLSVGHGFTRGNKTFGFLVAATYSHKEQYLLARAAQTAIDQNGQVVSQNEATQHIGSAVSALSALGQIGFSIGQDHELRLLTFYTRAADIRSQQETGFSVSDNREYSSSRLQFVARQLSFNQLYGVHRLGSRKYELNYQANFSHVDRNEPDTRDLAFYVDSGVTQFANRPNGRDRFFSNLNENSGGATAHLKITPLDWFILKFGGLTQLSFRDFGLRRFQFSENKSDPVPAGWSAEQIFSKDSIGTHILLSESTLNEDAYTANLNIFGGYADTEFHIRELFKIYAGARFEASTQTLTGDSPFAPGAARSTQKQYFDFIPAVNVAFTPTSTINVRAGYSYTLARPTFRELAPFYFFDAVRRRGVSGNPALTETRIHNIDLRFEWFFAASQLVSVSAFAKKFNAPIERVIANTAAQDVTYKNANSATLLGLELEARLGLGTLAKILSDFKLGGNLTLNYSRVDLGANQGLQTSSVRALYNTSPYVVNASVSWARAAWGTEISLLYNVYGPRITEVGIEGLPDVYEQPFHRLDAAISQDIGKRFTVKVTAQNIFNSPIRLLQGKVEVQKFFPGATFTAQLALHL